MPDWLAPVAKVLPMTWATDVVTDLTSNAEPSGGTWVRLGLLGVLVFAMLVVAAASMPRQTR
ncbi:ABC transporter permease [Tessaracoccus coleopterorum]|uniref:ABC transporter permease n=1 Tax=Tessaracoccus coleopterorum TaxID=2714950 RepID=UPI0018D4C831|nr:ABC transporter permease [Tessaracoccus coleopterorum]